jgi:hypothetical protein
MNIFDPLISGSLSVSGSGRISGDLTVLGTINATISGTTSNAISASHAASYTLTSSFGAFTSSYTTGSFTGSFGGDGSNLTNIPSSGVTGLNLTRIADGSATASISNIDGLRVNTNTEITGALTISGSITLNGVPVGTGKLDEVVFNSYSSSNNTTNSLQNGRLDSLEVSTSSLNTFTSSTNTRLGVIESTTASLNSFTSSTNGRLNSLESTSGSINIFTSSASGRLNSLETTTSSLNSYTSSTDTRLGIIETTTGSLNSYTSSNNTIIGTLQTATSSLNSYTSSNTTNINAIHGTTSSLNTFTSSANGRLTSIETSTSSLNTFTSSASDRLTSIESATSSIRTDFNSFTSSNNSVESTQNGRLTSLENVTGSYATTGSNIFFGNQTITGSLFISQNLIVQGSSSIENITASAVSIGTNTIVLNTDSPAFRYAGISVFDSGSTSVTASLFYDSLTNQWKFKHTDTGTNDASIMLFGPLGNDIDSTPLLDGNFLTKVENNSHGHHLTTSSIFDNGSKVSINSNSEITGSLTVTGVVRSTTTPLVSSSIQIDHNATTNYVANRHIDHTTVSVSSGNGLSGGGTIAETRTLTLDTGSVHFLDGVKKELNTEGVISGSSQVLGGTTIHSGSFFNGITVVSGSAQVSFNGIVDKPTLVSGSSQITFGSISSIPGGIVSGSVQVDLTSTTNYSSGIKTRLNAEGVLSGSAQVVAALPSGTVSGSAQITLSSTTGYGSVINQAVLTTSSPTFSTVNATTFSDGYINYTLAQINRTGGFVELQYASGGGVKMFGGGATPITFATTGGATFSGAISASNFSGSSSGTNTGDQTNISGTAGSETLSTVTGRGASTSTAISINNTLTVTSGRVIARTGGANTYGIFSGYDNNNHMMSFRAAIAGSTTTPTITAGHQTTFIEYAEANETTGWFFKSASTGTYEEIAKITRIGITPGSNGTQNLGSASLRWNTVFTSDLSLSNGIGDYTIVEGENDLFLYNNKQNKVYKFMLQEVNPNDATPKRPE